VSEQVLSQSAFKTLQDYRVSMNVNTSASNRNFIFFHFFGNSALKELWPFQTPAFLNLRKGFCDLGRLFRGQGFCFFVAASHIDNGKGVFENFAVMRQFVV